MSLPTSTDSVMRRVTGTNSLSEASCLVINGKKQAVQVTIVSDKTGDALFQEALQALQAVQSAVTKPVNNWDIQLRKTGSGYGLGGKQWEVIAMPVGPVKELAKTILIRKDGHWNVTEGSATLAKGKVVYETHSTQAARMAGIKIMNDKASGVEQDRVGHIRRVAEDISDDGTRTVYFVEDGVKKLPDTLPGRDHIQLKPEIEQTSQPANLSRKQFVFTVIASSLVTVMAVWGAQYLRQAEPA